MLQSLPPLTFLVVQLVESRRPLSTEQDVMTTTLDHPTTSPHSIARPIMAQAWKTLAYLHWPVDPTEVASRLPHGLEPDTFAGRAWVGLVAFRMERIRVPGTPAIPYFGTFPETNVRTYVRDSSGRPGVWFDSLDVTRLAPVLVARATYRLPYMWAKMSIAHDGSQVTYRTRRRWPGPAGVSSDLTIRRGEPVAAPTPLERFLTARWGLYTRLGTQIAYAPVEHVPWPLERAEVGYIHDELVAAAAGVMRRVRSARSAISWGMGHWRGQSGCFS